MNNFVNCWVNIEYEFKLGQAEAQNFYNIMTADIKKEMGDI